MACAACGYNLRGLPGRMCPECGGTIEPAHLMFAGPEALSIRGIVRFTGVPGALAACAALHMPGLFLAPGVYGWIAWPRIAGTDLEAADRMVTLFLLVTAGLAWGQRRMSASAGEGVPGWLADPAVQSGAAWLCWIAAVVKALLLAVCVAILLLG